MPSFELASALFQDCEFTSRSVLHAWQPEGEQFGGFRAAAGGDEDVLPSRSMRGATGLGATTYCYVIDQIALVYRNDKTAKELNLSPQERLLFHQRESGPVMKNLKQWLSEQLDQKKTEPNSGLGKAIAYMLKHWDPLTLFLRVPGAPLDNNLCERALKKAILNRKNSLFYKTEHGAFIGDMFMSLIHTCNLGEVNPFDYLTALQKHSSEVFKNPGTGCPGIIRTASPSTIPDESAPPNILNQTLPAALQPGSLGNVCPSASPPANFFPLRRLTGNSQSYTLNSGVGSASLTSAQRGHQQSSIPPLTRVPVTCMLQNSGLMVA